jgi:hypothetical protein
MTTQREGLLGKIRALLNKTMESGCTEAEAMAALDKARAMMDAHEISEDELRQTKAEAAVLRSEPPDSLDPHNIKWHLMSAVADFCSCEVWQTRRRDTKQVAFCGLQSDAQYATWLLDALVRFVQGDLVRHLMETQPPKSEKRRVIRGFVEGICDRISHRLRSLREQSAAAATSNGRELVLVKNAAVTAKMEECDIRVRGRCLGGQTNEAGYQAGQAAGIRDLHKHNRLEPVLSIVWRNRGAASPALPSTNMGLARNCWNY